MTPNVQDQPAPDAIGAKTSPPPGSPGRQPANSRPRRAADRVWRVKLLRCLKRQRNRVDPSHRAEQKVLRQQAGCEFFAVSPRRVLRVLRPELKAGRFYDPPRNSTAAAGLSARRESIEDNFYARWARRPHPSGNCRCSFRRSTASSRASQASLEELAVSQQINRIRASLCEAERSGRSAEAEIEHIERTLGLPLTNLQLQVPSAREVGSRLEPLDERTRERIVEGLEKYISNLLDEILDETIRALAKADRPFESGKSATPASFDISFSFHGKEAAEDEKSSDRGYVNQGFVGSVEDPDALNFQLRRHEVVVAEEMAVDCVDSGINSVETIELQPEASETMEQQQDLEQSLMEIIDAKLGGTSIGKSLENLGLEIDAEDRADSEGKSRNPETVEAQHVADPNLASRDKGVKQPAPSSRAEVQQHQAPKSSSSPSSSLGHLAQAPRPASERTSRSLDEVTEEPRFNSLRLQFKRRNNASNSSNSSKPSPTKPPSQQQPRVLTARKLVSCRLNKTMRMIRRRLAARLACTPIRRKPASSSASPSKAQQQQQNQQQHQQSSLELEDYRRRFPVPELRQGQKVRVEEDWEGSVRLRNRKPTLVFLHGFGSSADAFGPQLEYFAELGYPCIAPDLLGHGMSSAPSRASEYKFCKLLADLETILAHYAFKPGHKCVIVAHNYGCSFATVLADKHAGSVHQLVLISGGGPTPLAPPPKEGPGHCCLRAGLAPLLVCGLQRAVLYSARGRQHPYCGDPDPLPEPRGDDAAEEVDEAERGLREKRLEEAAMRQRPSHMRHVLAGMSWPEGDYVFHRRIATPTLLVHGLRDNKVSLVQECQMERTMVKAFLEAIPAAGHMPMTDCPDQLNHMIHCFIDLWKNKKW